MATVPKKIEYPTSDGKPMAETDFHRALMFDLIHSLEDYYTNDPMTYVSGDLLVFYDEGNKRRHLAPDVFVILGVPKKKRLHYLVWEEGKGPDFVIEVTSKTTRREDQGKKRDLYRDVLRVPEYFLFDPFAEYLKPPLQGYRRERDEYIPIEPVDGRLPSAVTGLLLERDGQSLRLYSPALGRWLHTTDEKVAAAEAHAAEAVAQAAQTDARLAAAEAELERLRREIEAMKRAKANGPGPANGASA
jgi:Uma2 family endonuclease